MKISEKKRFEMYYTKFSLFHKICEYLIFTKNPNKMLNNMYMQDLLNQVIFPGFVCSPSFHRHLAPISSPQDFVLQFLPLASFLT